MALDERSDPGLHDDGNLEENVGEFNEAEPTSYSTKPRPTASNPIEEATGFSAKWTRTINTIHIPVIRALLWTSNKSATNPRRTVSLVTFVSVALIVIGIFTNFSVDVDEDVLWTPKGARPVQHSDWIDDRSGFPTTPRTFIMFFHADTADVLGQAQVSRVFQALDAVRTLPEYDSICAKSSSTSQLNEIGEVTCPISGITAFWNDTASIFESQVSSDADVIEQLSATVYPDGTPVSADDIFGKRNRDANTGLLTKVQAYTVLIDFPDIDESEDFEEPALNAVLALQEQWEAQSANNFRLEVQAVRSFSDEFTRAIVADIPLVPIVFVIMSIFTCAVFFKRDKVRSRSLLGFSAVISVLLSIMSGYGLMFVSGVPFTSMTQILPFIIFGIGLDDAFIISGSYDRTDPAKSAVERIHDTVEDVGASITLTTVSSTLAFGLGATSDVPAVFWLCYYAFPTIILVFLYQITFFVACIVLDEKRVQDNRRDCCVCLVVDASDESEPQALSNGRGATPSVIDYYMGLYAKQILRPVVQIPVVICFCALLGVCAYSATLLTQEFKFTDVLPDGSYVADFQTAFDENTVRSAVAPYAYFRFVDQSDGDIQRQMEAYVDELVTIEAIEEGPEFFWLRDFKEFVNVSGSQNLEFNSQIAAFLSNPVYGDLYNDHVVRDDAGTIVTSRVRLLMDNVDVENVNEQVDALEDQSSVSGGQNINQGRGEWAFFTYDGIYNIWEFYAASVNEVIFTTVLGVASVTGITLIFVPHWSAAFFVLPLICILYVDLLGAMQWAGVHINAVSYISLVMSIGLMVDFLLHVLLRYYESPGNRKEKTLHTLETMGASVLVGGISTFLGTLPLAFSSSTIFYTVFVAFIGLVTLGCGHGLILLPIILSNFGPEDQIEPSKVSKTLEHCETEISQSQRIPES
jgi:Niemann-Pick C1 protein